MAEGIKTPEFKQQFSYLMPNEEVRGIGAPYASETDFATASKPSDMDRYPGVGVVVTQLPNPIYGKFIRLPEGSALTPGLAFATVDDDDSGLYLSSVGVVGMSINGAANMTWSTTVIAASSTRVDISGQLRIGTATDTTAAGEFSAKSAATYTFSFIGGVTKNTNGYYELVNGATTYIRLGSSTSFFTSTAGDNILAVGPIAAAYYVHISRESNAIPGENPEICLDGAGTFALPFVFGIRSRGTYALATTIIDQDALLEFDGRGYDGTAYSGPQVDISMEAAGTWAVGDHPTRITFSTTPSGSTTIADRWKIQPDGTLLAGGNNTIDIGNSAGTGKPRDLYLGRQFLPVDGSAGTPPYSLAGDTDTGLFSRTAGGDLLSVSCGGTARAEFTTTAIQLASDINLSWSSNTIGSASDVILNRFAAGLCFLHNTTSTSAGLHIANTRTSATVYESVRIAWLSNVAVIQTLQAGGVARLLSLNYNNDVTNYGLRLGAGISSGITLAIGNYTTTSGQRVLIGSTANETGTSGSAARVSLGSGGPAPSASSTLKWSGILFESTINYAGGGNGRANLVRFAPVNTALPTGLNCAIHLSLTASTLGGIHFHNQTDETTNYELGKIAFISSVFTISSTQANAGTARNMALIAPTILLSPTAALTINEDGADADTRIEGDTLPYMIFCDASAATENIAFLATGAPGWGGMDRGFYVENVTTAPSSNPTSGFFHYSSGGQPTWRDDGGVVYSLTQATGGQNVTNSVTNDGSTDGTIPDIADGLVYANDYVNLRRALFQISRMLKQDHDQLRAMGILT